MLKVVHHGHERLIIVINGAPYYLSTGLNSGSEKTWFFFAGVSENHKHHPGWFIKPHHSKKTKDRLEDYLGAYAWGFIRHFKIDKEISISRFGDLPKLCISASLGGGFWDTKTGRALRSFLLENYKMYFLTNSQLPNLTSCEIEVLSKSEDINNWLKKEGVDFAGSRKVYKQLAFIHDYGYDISYERYSYLFEAKETRHQNKASCRLM